jgi:hypothetical protein
MQLAPGRMNSAFKSGPGAVTCCTRLAPDRTHSSFKSGPGAVTCCTRLAPDHMHSAFKSGPGAVTCCTRLAPDRTHSAFKSGQKQSLAVARWHPAGHTLPLNLGLGGRGSCLEETPQSKQKGPPVGFGSTGLRDAYGMLTGCLRNYFGSRPDEFRFGCDSQNLAYGKAYGKLTGKCAHA